MNLDIYQVDAFTTEPFKGNPAGVCITENALEESLMFSIAAEMAVSETAFLSLSDFRLRWFTPRVEVRLCGHGTLATVHILKEKGLITTGEALAFNTQSGVLNVKLNKQQIEMIFPSPSIDFTISPNPKLLEHLGIHTDHVISYGCFDNKTFMETHSEEHLLHLKPNFDGLKQLQGRSVLITTKSASNSIDFSSRYFAPWIGINEDPVTGSAHCALAVYWGEKLGKKIMKGYQASERGGFVNVERLSKQRVKLMGTAVTVLKGTLYL